MELYNNSTVWCWIAPYPVKCGDGPDQTPCVRGINAGLYRWAFYYGPLWFMIFVVAFLMTLVYAYVRGLDAKMNKYTESYAAKAARERSQEMDTGGSGNMRRPSIIKAFSVTKLEEIKEQRKHRKNERSKAVANQGLFYAGTFALVWIFGTIVRAMQLGGAKPPWAIIFLFAVFTPSQGFFNFLVYVRPKLIRYFSSKKKEKRNSVDSFNSNHLHVSGISGASSVEGGKRDASLKSEDVKLIDPFIKSSGKGALKATSSEALSVKTKADACSEEAMSE